MTTTTAAEAVLPPAVTAPVGDAADYACNECACGKFEPIPFVAVRCDNCFHMAASHRKQGGAARNTLTAEALAGANADAFTAPPQQQQPQQQPEESEGAAGEAATTGKVAPRIPDEAGTGDNDSGSGSDNDMEAPVQPQQQQPAAVTVAVSPPLPSVGVTPSPSPVVPGLVTSPALSSASDSADEKPTLAVPQDKERLNLDLNDVSQEVLQRRVSILRDLLTSERTYVEHLQDCIEIFLIPLCSATEPVIPSAKINDIFYNLPLILELNTILLFELERKLKCGNSYNDIGEVFSNLASYFKEYRHYATAFFNAQLALEDAEKLPAFAAFLKEQAASPRLKGQTLRDLLSLPLQRIPRYTSLLQEYMQLVSGNKAEVQYLQHSLDHIRGVAEQITEVNQHRENHQKLLELADKYHYPDLVQPHRVFVREGTLSKVCRKAVKPRIFMLFNDILVYGTLSVGGLVHRVLLLASLQLDDIPDGTDKLTNAFKVTSAQKTFVVFTDAVKDKVEWMLAINNCADKLKHIKQSFAPLQRNANGCLTIGGQQTPPLQVQSPSSPSPPPAQTQAQQTPQAQPQAQQPHSVTSPADGQPTWENDRAVTKCPLCSSEFTLLVRKHHCRVCGKIVCGTCSNNRITWSDNTKQRVCTVCFAARKCYANQ
eukprot:TRINITY_DN6327_c0_g1_i1.p1 TRINITY_DN6327_c0_g1~~TRINITY_DN6327_c0_g1_i1.p1  ORF type:complete len:669 (+),score=217.00 TRINITY_DN6327_c0_g1_i1:41-2008(+)